MKTDNEMGDEVAERIDLAQNRIPWQSVVKVRINMWGISRTIRRPSAFQVEL